MKGINLVDLYLYKVMVWRLKGMGGGGEGLRSMRFTVGLKAPTPSSNTLIRIQYKWHIINPNLVSVAQFVFSNPIFNMTISFVHPSRTI